MLLLMLSRRRDRGLVGIRNRWAVLQKQCGKYLRKPPLILPVLNQHVDIRWMNYSRTMNGVNDGSTNLYFSAADNQASVRLCHLRHLLDLNIDIFLIARIGQDNSFTKCIEAWLHVQHGHIANISSGKLNKTQRFQPGVDTTLSNIAVRIRLSSNLVVSSVLYVRISLSNRTMLTYSQPTTKPPNIRASDRPLDAASSLLGQIPPGIHS